MTALTLRIYYVQLFATYDNYLFSLA